MRQSPRANEGPWTRDGTIADDPTRSWSSRVGASELVMSRSCTRLTECVPSVYFAPPPSHNTLQLAQARTASRARDAPRSSSALLHRSVRNGVTGHEDDVGGDAGLVHPRASSNSSKPLSVPSQMSMNAPSDLRGFEDLSSLLRSMPRRRRPCDLGERATSERSSDRALIVDVEHSRQRPLRFRSLHRGRRHRRASCPQSGMSRKRTGTDSSMSPI